MSNIIIEIDTTVKLLFPNFVAVISLLFINYKL